MTIPEMLGASWAQIAVSALATVGIYAFVIVATRLLGLRTFAKMSSFDFAATIATGSMMASAASGGVGLTAATVGITVLFLLQWGVSRARSKGPAALFDNQPLLLMEGRHILEDNLARSRVTQKDLMAKLRAANVVSLSQVRFVVLETNGDVSVVHGSHDVTAIDDELFDHVER